MLSASLYGLLLGFALLTLPAAAQTTAPNEWTWMGGSSTSNQPGVYGTLGTPAAGNIPGGTAEAMSWIDKNGNFWVFGAGGSVTPSLGSPENGLPNDLWEFNTSSNEWTWIGGSSVISGCGYWYGCGILGVYGTLGTPAAGNTPGSRWGATGWIDSSGNLWLFGGYGYDAVGEQGYLNDLWEYNPLTNEWAWMGGSNSESYIGAEGWGQPGVYGNLGVPVASNMPGSRAGASSWIDNSGNFWLFGGQGFDATNHNFGYLNDLWKFDLQTNVWIWMGGDDRISICNTTYGSCGNAGVYGTLGVPATGNKPGGRNDTSVWKDSNGNVWLFGGWGYDGSGNDVYLDDLWRFNPSSNEWTWKSGPSIAPIVNLIGGQWGIYGILGVPDSNNIPGGRAGAASWIDNDGNLWLFGGSGLDANRDLGSMNDLWYFNPSTSEWTWMGGSESESNCYGDPSESPLTYCGGVNGVYGTLGVQAVGNTPGARSSASSWTDGSGNLWLFGGDGYDANNTVAWPQNDIWEYQPSTTSLPPALTPTFSAPSGTYSGGQLGIFEEMTNASIHYTIDGSTPTSGSTPYSGPITLTSSETVKAIAIAPGYPNSGIASVTFIIEPLAATPSFSVASGTYTSKQTVVITDATAGATMYYTIDGSKPTTNSTPYTGPITVSLSETIEVIAVANGYLTSAVSSATYTINLLIPSFTVSSTAFTNTPGQTNGNTPVIYVEPVNGFAGDVTLTAALTTSPIGAHDLPTFSFNTTSVSLGGGEGGSVILTINTTAPTNNALADPQHRCVPWFAAGGTTLACILLCGIPARRRRWRTLFGLAVILVFLTSGALSCGSGGGVGGGGGSGRNSDPGTTAGVYTITVTGTSGTSTATGTVTLNVQ